MISREQSLQFADEWVAAWNAHDLDAVLEHYTEDFEMSSPFILQMGISPDGRLKGKGNVRNYWEKALVKFPDLHFELHEVLSCMNTVIVILLRIFLLFLSSLWQMQIRTRHYKMFSVLLILYLQTSPLA